MLDPVTPAALYAVLFLLWAFYFCLPIPQAGRCPRWGLFFLKADNRKEKWKKEKITMFKRKWIKGKEKNHPVYVFCF